MQKTPSNPHKVSTRYLDAISSHLDEKTRYIASAITNDELPLIGGRVRMLEIGIGGGQTIRALKDQFGEKIDITGIDVSAEIVGKVNGSGINSVMANVCDLPFDNASFSCVNAASVLHEVSSYGYTDCGSTIYGIEAVKLALREMKRVLCPEGMLFYRDVMAPDKNIGKEIHYKNTSWKFFIDHFLPDFINSGSACHKDDYLLQKNDAYYSITGDSALHREIQKHYLLWAYDLAHALPEEYLTADGGINSRNIYAFVDKMISKADKKGKLFRIIEKDLKDWLLREGREHYLYWSIDEIIQYCGNDTDEEDVLIPKRKGDIIRLVREEENEYLKKIINDPETEGKQLINFTKTAIKNQPL